jgi:hypothetical protein
MADEMFTMKNRWRIIAASPPRGNN